MNRSIPLAELQPGQKAIIAHLRVDEALHHRLSAMGLRLGRPIEVVRRAALSGPIQVRVGFMDLMLRRTDASKISVSPCL